MNESKELSAPTKEIFRRIAELYPPDPWGKQQWKEEGLVYDNGWHDLRDKQVRARLIDRLQGAIGLAVIISAKVAFQKKAPLMSSIFRPELHERSIRLVCLLEDLDYQIETGDLVDPHSPPIISVPAVTPPVPNENAPIRFEFEDKRYEVDESAYRKSLILLPDGRVISPSSWLESLPPIPEGLRVVVISSSHGIPLAKEVS